LRQQAIAAADKLSARQKTAAQTAEAIKRRRTAAWLFLAGTVAWLGCIIAVGSSSLRGCDPTMTEGRPGKYLLTPPNAARAPLFRSINPGSRAAESCANEFASRIVNSQVEITKLPELGLLVRRSLAA
jgi:hypothetical protein